MICGKCSAINDDGDRFCYKCGTLLPSSSQSDGTGNSEPTNATADGSAGNPPETEDRLAISATTTLAAKKARISDVKGMRPLTQAAYNIVESDNGSIYSMVISLLNIIISLSAVAVIIETFETINLIIEASTGSKMGLGQFYEAASSSSHSERLIWCIVLLAVLVVAFVICGRLSIRISKVNRKKRRENLTSRLS